jgi:hypothetical protein
VTDVPLRNSNPDSRLQWSCHRPGSTAQGEQRGGTLVTRTQESMRYLPAEKPLYGFRTPL